MTTRHLRMLSASGAALALAPFVLAGGCTTEPKQGAPTSSASAAPTATASGSATAGSAFAPTLRGADELKPVYPIDAGAPDPLAQRFCDALYLLPGRRSSDCCGGAMMLAAANVIGQQCVRTLTFALASHAVTLASADVDACVEAMTAAT